MKKYPKQELESPIPGSKAYTFGKCTVLVGIEHKKWHLSISNANRYPKWDEISAARYEFIPDDITVAMILPSKKNYVNIYKNCFHLWEIDEDFN